MKTNSLPKVLVALFTACLLSYVFISCKESREKLIPNDSSISQTSNSQIKKNDLLKVKVNSNQINYIEDETIKGDFELRNGVLHFKNAEIYFKILREFGKMKPEERLAASKAMKLKSLLEEQQNFISEIEKIDGKGKQEQILKKYSDILKVGENYVDFLNVDKVSAALVNRRGIVYLGKSLRCYKGLEQINIENGDENLLNNTQNSEIVKKYQYLTPLNDKNHNARVSNVCPHFNGTMTNGDNLQQNCAYCFAGHGGDRAIILQIFASTNNNGNGTTDVAPYAIGLLCTHKYSG